MNKQLDSRTVSDINAMITHRILDFRAELIRQGQLKDISAAGPSASRQAFDYSQSGHTRPDGSLGCPVLLLAE